MFNRILFSVRFQSGFHPPGDVPFEDLSKLDVESTISQSIPTTNQTMRGGTMGAKNLKKRVGLFGIFGSSKVRKNYVFFPVHHSS
jgi:formin-binding protein 1